MPKPKKIATIPEKLSPQAAADACAALARRFAQFTFSVDGPDIKADGPWDRPANERPAMSTMSSWAEGYMQRAVDPSTEA